MKRHVSSLRLARSGRSRTALAVMAAALTGLALPSAGVMPTASGSPAGTASSSGVPLASTASADANAVITWNENATEASIAACSLGGAGPAEARMYAMAHIAIHDALNGIDRRSRPYAADLHAPSWTSPDAAVASAARNVLVSTFASYSFLAPPDCINAGIASVEADYTAALAAIPSGPAKARGIALGRDAAAAILALRADDGIDSPFIDPNFQEGTEPGEYRYTPGFPFAAVPHLGEDLKPFVLARNTQFRPRGPLPLRSARYAADVNEIQRLGGDDITTPSARSAVQTEIALFWVQSSPEMWNRIARSAAASKGLDPWQSARLLALLNMGLTDGYIGSLETKYHYLFWRPVTAIQLADTDGNPRTTTDPTWTPLLPTPPIPDYDSGHAVEGGVGAQVLKRFFHTDKVSFSVCSYSLSAGEACADSSPTVREFTSFSQAARENAVSRIYVGFHFRDAVVVGTHHGKKIANWTVNHTMRPVH